MFFTINIFSKENFIRINNIFFILMAFIIQLTIFIPLILDCIFTEKISLGARFYNELLIPILVPLIILMVITPYIPWDKKIKLKYYYYKEFSFGFVLLFSYLLLNYINFPLFINIYIYNYNFMGNFNVLYTFNKNKKNKWYGIGSFIYYFIHFNNYFKYKFTIIFYSYYFYWGYIYFDNYKLIFRNIHEFCLNNYILIFLIFY